MDAIIEKTHDGILQRYVQHLLGLNPTQNRE